MNSLPSFLSVTETTKKYTVNPVRYKQVELKKHQIFPAYYLRELEPKQKGLLLNHLMGTGKTISGLHFFRVFQDYTTYLVCPKPLVPTWMNEIANLGMSPDTITIHTYEEIFDVLKNTKATTLRKSVVVFDEVHLFIELIRYKYAKDDVFMIIDKLKEFHKILLMTGTPFYNDFYDIIYLINIAAGVEVLPYNTDEFNEKYFTTSLIKSVSYGWINPVLEQKITLIGLIAFHFGMMVRYPYDVGNEHSMSHIYLRNYFKLFGLDIDKTQSYSFGTLMAVQFSIFGFAMLIAIFADIMGRYDLNRIRNISVKQLARDTQRFISFFRPKGTDSWIKKYQIQLCHTEQNTFIYRLFCKNYLKELEESKFPVYEFKVKYTTFTAPQYDFFLRFCYNRLTLEDMKSIEIDESLDRLRLFGHEKAREYDVFTDKGRAIGNLILHDEHSESVAWIYPRKFEEIIKRSKDKQTVIYSNFFQGGILYFAQFLKYLQIPFEILDVANPIEHNNRILKEFTEKKYRYLLIHPDLFQGINIIGAEQLHILEPLTSHPKMEQLFYRVIRYQSHTHLPLKERKVKIYLWITEVLPFFQKAAKKMEAWHRFSPQVIYWKRLAKFDQDVAPDSIVYDNLSKQKKIFENFTEYLQTESIESCSQKNDRFLCNLPVSVNQV